jgi:hypothetical protein
MKFDIIPTNPPFQDVNNKGKTQHKIWIDFTRMEIGDLLKPGGFLLQVSPSSFLSPSSKVLDIFKKYKTQFINLDTGVFFPKIGSTFASYKIINEENNYDGTKVTLYGKDFYAVFNNELFYLPRDICEHSYNIHTKFNSIKTKYSVKFDYVTAHNIILKRGDTLSKTKTDLHVHPLLHTNPQTWYTKNKQVWADYKKVMWSRSGYTKPFYDPGRLGGTDMCYYIIVENDKQGYNLETILNSKLFSYIFNTARWSGFGNERVFVNLPYIDYNKSYTDEEIYKIFSLTQSEIDYIESKKENKLVKDLSFYQTDPRWSQIKDLMDKHSYMSGVERDAHRVRQTAEVFTPTDCVLQNIYNSGVEHWGPGKTILDPACGDGQWLHAAKLVKMIFHGMPEVNALGEIFGCDLQQDNIDICRKRLSNISNTMLHSNLVCQNSLEYDYSFGRTNNDQNSEFGNRLFYLNS